MSADLRHRHPTDPKLHTMLQRWVTQSLITPTEADAIEAFEGRETTRAQRGVPLLTEALIYVGAALAAAAAAVLLGQRWDDLTPVTRAVSAGTASVVALTAGWALHRGKDPTFARAASVAWLVATGLSGWLAWLIAYDVLGHRGRVPALAAGVTMAVLGAFLYLVLRRGLQQIAVLVGVLTVVGASFGEGSDVMVAVWAVAVAWIVAGGFGLLPPKDIAFVCGPVVALWAPLALDVGDVGMWLGLGTGIGLVVAGVALHQSVLLGFGAFGVFAYVIRVLVRLFGDTAAMPIALLAVGVIVLVLAVTYARRSGREPTQSARPRPS
jgi:hypothetical protein